MIFLLNKVSKQQFYITTFYTQLLDFLFIYLGEYSLDSQQK